MAWLHGTAAPKGETRKTIKGRADRTEAKVKKAVRAECVDRDGDCRICDWEKNPGDIHADDLEYPDDIAFNPSMMNLWRWLSLWLWSDRMSARWLSEQDVLASRVEYDGVCITFPIQKDA